MSEAKAWPSVFQELFSKQKGYLDEELDYRKQALDQAHKVSEWRGRHVPADSPSEHLKGLCGQAQNFRRHQDSVWGHSLPFSV